MSSVLDVLTSQLSGDAIGTISRQIGADPHTTQDAIGAALPMLLGALAKNSASTEGAASLHRALGRHDGSIMDDLLGSLTRPGTAMDGAAILGHVLGNRRPAMEQGIGSIAGLDSAQVAKLLALLAPIVLGALGRQTRNQNLDVGGLSDMLARQGAQARQRMPQQASILTSLLDQDGDGSIADDVGRMGMNVLGGLFNKNRQ